MIPRLRHVGGDPAVLRRNGKERGPPEDRVRRRQEGTPVRKPDDADVYAVGGTDGNVFSSRTQMVRDYILKERTTHLTHRVFGPDCFRHDSDSETTGWSTVARERRSPRDART